MWLLIARSPAPDMRYWQGRRWLGALDALFWPCLWLVAVHESPFDLGLIGAVGTASAVAFGLRRLWTATHLNHRYRFTTWRVLKLAALALLIGTVLKMAL